jgi:hypothetical protein
MAPAFMATIELVCSGRPNADGGQRIPSPSPNKRQLKGLRSTIPLKLAPSGWNELAPYVYRNFTWLKGNDDSYSVLLEA